MKVLEYNCVDDFLARAGNLIHSNAVINGQAIGVLQNLKRDLHHYGEDNPYFVVAVDEDDSLVAVLLRTPPFPLQVLHLVDGDISPLISFIKDKDPNLPSVIGPNNNSERFANEFCESPIEPNLRLHMSLYYLERVIRPVSTNGTLRPAKADDFDLVFKWSCQFSIDCNLPEGPPTRERVRNALEAENYFFWMVESQPVALFLRIHTPATGIDRIGSVYTPAQLRGRGYGSDGTAALCRLSLENGASGVTLYADVQNPTSNSIYQNVGFDKVTEVRFFELS